MPRVKKESVEKSTKTKCELHNKRKDICKICSPHLFCPHGRRPYGCKDCGGEGICEHKRLKSGCKECKGGSICKHNRTKSSCKECGGGSLCIHKIIKAQCKECDGNNFCIHKIKKYYCKECGGKAFCEHKRIKSQCKECDGSQICEHKKVKSDCVKCEGSKICEHNVRKYTCKKCNGKGICKHGTYKSMCKPCGGKRVCKSEWCETSVKNKKYEGYCARCFMNLFPDKPMSKNYKTKEKAVVDFIKEQFKDKTWINDKRVKDGCSKRRPDLLCDLGDHVLVIEIDENNHESYNCSCENKRLMELSTDVGHRPLTFVRFNPDDYIDKTGNKIKSCWIADKNGLTHINRNMKKNWEERLNNLKLQTEYWIKNPTNKTLEVIELYYNQN